MKRNIKAVRIKIFKPITLFVLVIILFPFFHLVASYILNLNTIRVEVIGNEIKEQLSIVYLNEEDIYPGKRHIPRKELVLYSNGHYLNSIPEIYGKDYFILKYDNIGVDTFKNFKFRGWHDFDYCLNIQQFTQDRLILKWKLVGNFRSCSIDTISIAK